MKPRAQRSSINSMRAQHGAALVFSLAILLVLTLLTVSALRTSTLEQTMAGNTQESTRAFEAAESGLAKSLADKTTFASMSGAAAKNYTFGSMNAQATVDTTYVQTTKPSRGAVPTGQGTSDVAHFNQKSVADTTTGARSTLHQGVKKNIPKAN